MSQKILTTLLGSLLLMSCGGNNSETPPEPLDTTPPSLSIRGPAVISIQQGSVFSDQGTIANDNIDGDISSVVKIVGEVDTHKLGEYILTYNVSDSAGNAAVTVIRTVRVINDGLLLQVSIDTKGQTIVDEPKILATMQVRTENEIIYDANIGIEIRGSSSQSFDKKSFGFETWDDQGKGTDIALAGFPAEEDWILYGPYSDKSMLRNVIIYQLANQMGHYAVRTKFAEVSINHQYRGIYVLMEKIKRDKNRVDISKLKEDDITGGYIIKIDKITGEDPSLDFFFDSAFDGFGKTNASQKIKFLYEYPKPKDISVAGKAYIQKYYHDFEHALISDSFTDAEMGYRHYINVNSFIDFFLMNELSHNVDAYRISTFMHKDKGEKLKMGPIWDFNIAFGNADYCRGETIDDWAYKFNEYCPEDSLRVPFWWARLLQDPTYVAALKERWLELRADILSQSNIQGMIAEHVINLKYSNAVTRNFDTFDILGIALWPNFFVGDTYEQEIDYLNDWISRRLVWMDTEIAKL
ncbi:CotH kinase family protein [Paraglaciecola sp.]|uniref:CotH kinase family protein n=1 Tax=Paraglaciecola sp. TaxID=1920173 RepID=UPI0030F418C2